MTNSDAGAYLAVSNTFKKALSAPWHPQVVCWVYKIRSKQLLFFFFFFFFGFYRIRSAQVEVSKVARSLAKLQPG